MREEQGQLSYEQFYLWFPNRKWNTGAPKKLPWVTKPEWVTQPEWVTKPKGFCNPWELGVGTLPQSVPTLRICPPAECKFRILIFENPFTSIILL